MQAHLLLDIKIVAVVGNLVQIPPFVDVEDYEDFPITSYLTEMKNMVKDHPEQSSYFFETLDEKVRFKLLNQMQYRKAVNQNIPTADQALSNTHDILKTMMKSTNDQEEQAITDQMIIIGSFCTRYPFTSAKVEFEVKQLEARLAGKSDTNLFRAFTGPRYCEGYLMKPKNQSIAISANSSKE
ncbi:unnamed protein product [Ambrosiozyma monospora]|uniref:Unnamed protein product n=1 Tax=Ambrosiozyma monospora TaxID=43982 RepID=A0ACB5SUY5_AMBMO|nr:unnamed protein product [Ambrosiozyma monospora]